MIVDCISDLHGHFPVLEGGDLLIVAGDLTACDKGYQYLQFLEWLKEQKYRQKIVVAGNHDGLIEGGRWKLVSPCEYTGDKTIQYLQDSGCEFDGLKIWGSPWTPTFCDWHFMAGPEERKIKWDMIPEDTDILITHGPPLYILDECDDIDGYPKYAGCYHLRNEIENRLHNLKLHVFGHIHEFGCNSLVLKRHNSHYNTLCVNAALRDRNYHPRKNYIRCLYQNASFTPSLIHIP